MDETITFISGVPSVEGLPHAEFMRDFFILFRMALANLEAAEAEPSVMVGNTFFLKREDGGYLAVLPMEQKIFQANEALQIFEVDYELPLASLINACELVESVLNGPIYEVINTSPLSEDQEGLLITLNHFADLMIQAGQAKFASEDYLVKDDVLYLKWLDRGYLAINPSGNNATEKRFFVDQALIPRPVLFSIDVQNLKRISKELETQLIQANIIQPGDF